MTWQPSGFVLLHWDRDVCQKCCVVECGSRPECIDSFPYYCKTNKLVRMTDRISNLSQRPHSSHTDLAGQPLVSFVQPLPCISESRLPWLETTLWTRLGLSLPQPEERQFDISVRRFSVSRLTVTIKAWNKAELCQIIHPLSLSPACPEKITHHVVISSCENLSVLIVKFILGRRKQLGGRRNKLASSTWPCFSVTSVYDHLPSTIFF